MCRFSTPLAFEPLPILLGINTRSNILFGALQWPRVISAVPLLAADDPVAQWFERSLDHHGGIGRAMPAMGT